MAKKKKEPCPHLYRIKLFISKEPFQQIDDSNQLWLAIGPVHGMRIPHTGLIANYDERRHRLTIFQNNVRIFDREAYYGSAFEINNPQNRKKTKVSLLRYPHGTENAIPWICGYAKEVRTDDLKEFHQIRRTERAKLGVGWTNHGINHRGKHHRFSSITVDGKTHLTAAYADPRMDKEEIAQVVSTCRDPRYPLEFVKNVLYTQAGFRGSDFATVV